MDDYIKLLNTFSDFYFIEKNHRYECSGIPIKKSITQIISKYKKPFDSGMFSERIAKKEGIDQETVIEKWNFEKDFANHKGEEFHRYVENFLDRKKISIDRDSIRNFYKKYPDFYNQKSVDDYILKMANMISQFKNFYSWYSEKYKNLKSEFVIGDKIAKIAGMVDNLSIKNENKKLVIFDYKTNKTINKKNKYGEKLIYPLDHLDNCELVNYSLQIWLYRLILERNTNFEFDDCYFVWFSEKNYELHSILDLRNEATNILNIEINKNVTLEE